MSVPAPINIDSVPDQIGTAIMKANPNKFELVKVGEWEDSYTLWMVHLRR